MVPSPLVPSEGRCCSWGAPAEAPPHDPPDDPAALLFEAACLGRPLAAGRLLGHPRVGAGEVAHALALAAFTGRAGVVALLLDDPRAEPRGSDSLPLRFAAMAGHLGAVRCLLQDGRADPGALRGEALRSAAAQGHFEVAAALLDDRRVDPAALPDGPGFAAARAHPLVAAALSRRIR